MNERYRSLTYVADSKTGEVILVGDWPIMEQTFLAAKAGSAPLASHKLNKAPLFLKSLGGVGSRFVPPKKEADET